MKNQIHLVLAAGPALSFGLNSPEEYNQFIKKNRLEDPLVAARFFYGKVDTFKRNGIDPTFPQDEIAISEKTILKLDLLQSLSVVNYIWTAKCFNYELKSYLVKDENTNEPYIFPFFMAEVLKAADSIDKGVLMFKIKTEKKYLSRVKEGYVELAVFQCIPFEYDEMNRMVKVLDIRSHTRIMKVEDHKSLRKTVVFGDKGKPFSILARDHEHMLEIFKLVSPAY